MPSAGLRRAFIEKSLVSPIWRTTPHRPTKVIIGGIIIVRIIYAIPNNDHAYHLRETGSIIA